MGDTRLKRPAGHYLVSPAQSQEMEANLEPGDVLLSRKNWYLSNLGLPGFWPHAILYVGSNEALSAAFRFRAGGLRLGAAASGRDIPFSRYLEESYPLAWERRARIGSDEPMLTVLEAVSEGVIQNSAPRRVGRLHRRAPSAPVADGEGAGDLQSLFVSRSPLRLRLRLRDGPRPGLHRGGVARVSRVRRRARHRAPSDRGKAHSARERDRAVLPRRRRKRRAPLRFRLLPRGSRDAKTRGSRRGVERFLATVSRSKWDFGDE